MTHPFPPTTPEGSTLPPEVSRPLSRARLAEERRDLMRRRLIEAAILVFAERGVAGVVIADVIAQAGVARGSFYNHFRSTAELLEAACLELTAEILDQVEPRAAAVECPAEAMHIGAVLILRVAQAHPVLARFMAMLSPQANRVISELSILLPEVIARGVASGDFVPDDPQAMIDLTVGMLRQASLRVAHPPEAPPDPERFLRASSRLILRGLGVKPERLAEITSQPLPDIALAKESLLLRAQRLQDAAAEPVTSPSQCKDG